MNADKILFRCSSLGLLMTEPRSKSETLSETTKGHLIECFVREKYGRVKEFSNKYVEKGLSVEEDSITLLFKHTEKYFEKNEKRIDGDFITGLPDLFEGKIILEAENVLDIKSRWDLFTFTADRLGEVSKNEYWQMQGYMALTGAKRSQIVSTCVNAPEMMIMDEIKRMFYKSGVIDDSSKEFQAAADELRKQMTFDDVPIAERIFIRDIERNDSDIERMYQRVKDCRSWMNEYLFKMAA